jgi:peptidoglycan/xylan/chitin deacetylase (PgdA/CDA1 family)
MPATYLVRFDDICPTMNWAVWKDVEAALVEHGIAPLMAVVPDNRDPNLVVDAADPRFWDRVRAWQARGWTIGLHGYQHTYTTFDPGMLRLNCRSEFAGIGYGQQLDKLRSALEIFRRENVAPQVWVAPAHSFDAETLRALGDLGLRHISDGFAPAPYRDDRGFLWVPQQLWRFRRMPFGVWTVCHHVNSWTDGHIAAFRDILARFHDSIADFRSVMDSFSDRRSTICDSVYAGIHRAALTMKRRRNHTA